MIENPKVSVCVQTYNHVDYITECLDGILMQETNFPFEIILGEDESSDGTRDICKAYAQKYPDKIRLFLRSREDVIYVDGNPTGRYNLIENLSASKGKYIALCEGDDYWTDPNKLQKQVDFLKNNQDVNLCFNRSDLLINKEFKLHPIPEVFEAKAFNYIELLRHYNFIGTAGVLFRKPKFFNFPQWFLSIPFGDLGLYKIVLGDKKIGCINDVMSVYRIHDKGAYSGLGEIREKKVYLNFYNVIYNFLNEEEKQVVQSKRSLLRSEIMKLRFPKSKFLQQIYSIYLQFHKQK